MKTNKIKPIKKIMIFTIITVMIVSLFAVPAFAFTLNAPSGTMALPQPLADYTAYNGGVAVEFEFSVLVSYLGDDTVIFDTDDTYFCSVGIVSAGQDLDSISYFDCAYIYYDDRDGIINFYSTSSSSTPVRQLYTDANVWKMYLFMSADCATIWQEEVSYGIEGIPYTVYTLVGDSTSAPDIVWDSVSGYISPITFTPLGANTSVNTLGYYCITLEADDILSALSALNSEHNGSSYNFELMPDSYVFLGVHQNDGGPFYVSALSSGGADVSPALIKYVGGAEVTYISVSINGQYYDYEIGTTRSDGVPQIDVIVPEYPMILGSYSSDFVYFWNNVVYSVYQYGEAPIDPDPEEPDDPIPPAEGEEQGIFAVWSQITQWIVRGLASVSNAFYADGKLTLLGTLCIIPLALGLAFLLIGIIQKFLRLRG